MVLAQVMMKVRLEPKGEETDCIAHEHDLVVGSLSGIYGSNREKLLVCFPSVRVSDVYAASVYRQVKNRKE